MTSNQYAFTCFLDLRDYRFIGVPFVLGFVLYFCFLESELIWITRRDLYFVLSFLFLEIIRIFKRKANIWYRWLVSILSQWIWMCVMAVLSANMSASRTMLAYNQETLECINIKTNSKTVMYMCVPSCVVNTDDSKHFAFWKSVVASLFIYMIFKWVKLHI